MEGMYVLGGSRSSGGKRAGPTIYELNAGGQGRSARELPRLVGAGLTISVRAAGARAFGLAGAIGAAVALLAVAPLLVPVALLALIPGWLASGRRGRAFYHFGVVMTPRDRERGYLASLLTGRDPAKEVRAFGLAAFLRARHDRLYDERIAEMRRISSRQLRGMAAADLASATTIAAAIAGILWLAVSHHLALSSAAAGAAALVLLGREGHAGGGQPRAAEPHGDRVPGLHPVRAVGG